MARPTEWSWRSQALRSARARGMSAVFLHLSGFPVAQVELNRRLLAVVPHDRFAWILHATAYPWAARGAWDSALSALDSSTAIGAGRSVCGPSLPIRGSRRLAGGARHGRRRGAKGSGGETTRLDVARGLHSRKKLRGRAWPGPTGLSRYSGATPARSGQHAWRSGKVEPEAPHSWPPSSLLLSVVLSLLLSLIMAVIRRFR